MTIDCCALRSLNYLRLRSYIHFYLVEGSFNIGLILGLTPILSIAIDIGDLIELIGIEYDFLSKLL